MYIMVLFTANVSAIGTALSSTNEIVKASATSEISHSEALAIATYKAQNS